jgi:hypothetical protein
MEPLSALGLAAAVVQFVDFASRLFKDIRDSDETAKNPDLAVVTDDLRNLSAVVERKSSSLRATDIAPGSSNGILLRLCGECKEISSEPDQLLRQLRPENLLKFKTFVMAAKRVWSESKVKEMRMHLKEKRQQMMISGIICIW